MTLKEKAGIEPQELISLNRNFGAIFTFLRYPNTVIRLKNEAGIEPQKLINIAKKTVDFRSYCVSNFVFRPLFDKIDTIIQLKKDNIVEPQQLVSLGAISKDALALFLDKIDTVTTLKNDKIDPRQLLDWGKENLQHFTVLLNADNPLEHWWAQAQSLYNARANSPEERAYAKAAIAGMFADERDQSEGWKIPARELPPEEGPAPSQESTGKVPALPAELGMHIAELLSPYPLTTRKTAGRAARTCRSAAGLPPQQPEPEQRAPETVAMDIDDNSSGRKRTSSALDEVSNQLDQATAAASSSLDTQAAKKARI